MATIRYFAAAAEAAGTSSESVDAAELGELRQAVIDAHDTGFARVLERCSVLVDGVAGQSPHTPLSADSLVDVLPPFAGG